MSLGTKVTNAKFGEPRLSGYPDQGSKITSGYTTSKSIYQWYPKFGRIVPKSEFCGPVDANVLSKACFVASVFIGEI